MLPIEDAGIPVFPGPPHSEHGKGSKALLTMLLDVPWNQDYTGRKSQSLRVKGVHPIWLLYLAIFVIFSGSEFQMLLPNRIYK